MRDKAAHFNPHAFSDCFNPIQVDRRIQTSAENSPSVREFELKQPSTFLSTIRPHHNGLEKSSRFRDNRLRREQRLPYDQSGTRSFWQSVIKNEVRRIRGKRNQSQPETATFLSVKRSSPSFAQGIGSRGRKSCLTTSLIDSSRLRSPASIFPSKLVGWNTSTRLD